jgi:putative peptide zinc metalloprotease protein
MEKKDNWQGLQDRLVVETSENRPVYLLMVGNPPRYIRLSPFAYELLHQRSNGNSFAEMAEIVTQKTGKTISPSEIEIAYQKVFAEISEIEANQKTKLSGFLLRLPLIPKSIVNQIAVYLSVAYHRPVTLGLLGLMVAATVIAPQHDWLFNFTKADLIWGYFLFFISLLFHEFGHASACLRYGAEPSNIGLTIYLVFPAFYSDVSDAWRLKRWQRVIVDMGGVFFQLVICALYVIVYRFTDWVALKVAILAIASSCILYLNPVFKFDGYWALSDALGVTNLSRQPGRIFRHIFTQSNQSNPSKNQGKRLPWSPLMMSVLAVYTVASFSIMGYLILAVFPILWRELLRYPALVADLFHQLVSSPHAVSFEQMTSFLFSTMMVGIVLLLFGRLVQFLLAAIGQLIKRSAV